MTSYNEIWEFFLLNCKVEDINLPKSDEKIYKTIANAVIHMNNRIRTSYKCDDTSESLNEKLSEDHLLLLTHYIRLIFLKNEKTYFESTFQPFQKDVGIKKYSDQIKSLQSSVDEENRDIERLIRNMEDDYL